VAKAPKKTGAGQKGDGPKAARIAEKLKPLAVPIGTLKLDKKNARTHGARNLALIRSSLERFGQVQPVIVQRSKMRVVAGNARVIVMRELGWPTVAALVLDLDDRQASAFGVVDNRSAELAEWDDAKLAALVEEVTRGGALEVADLGFTDRELDKMLKDAGAGDEKDDGEGPTWKPPKRATSERGQVWRLGSHLLVVGDAFDPNVQALMRDGIAPLSRKLVACILTDPPYAIYGSSTGVDSDTADDKMVRPFFASVGNACAHVAGKSALVYVCCDWRSYPALYDQLRVTLTPKNLLVWNKGGGLGYCWQNSHELIAVMSAEPKRERIFRDRGSKGTRQAFHSNVLDVARSRSADKHHNAEKPIALLTRILDVSTTKGEVVVDLFAGSGSTLVTCEKIERVCRTCEIEPKWADVVVARWEQEAGQKAELLGTVDSLAPAAAAS